MYSRARSRSAGSATTMTGVPTRRKDVGPAAAQEEHAVRVKRGPGREQRQQVIRREPRGEREGGEKVGEKVKGGNTREGSTPPQPRRPMWPSDSVAGCSPSCSSRSRWQPGRRARMCSPAALVPTSCAAAAATTSFAVAAAPTACWRRLRRKDARQRWTQPARGRQGQRPPARREPRGPAARRRRERQARRRPRRRCDRRGRWRSRTIRCGAGKDTAMIDEFDTQSGCESVSLAIP